MKPSSIKPVRCAIYTRVSTEHGLDQEFNSLDAASAIHRLSGAGNLRRSDSTRNSISARPKIPNYGSAKRGIRLQPRSDFALNHGRQERNFWMQRQGAKSRHQNARTPTETRIRELSRRKCRT